MSKSGMDGFVRRRPTGSRASQAGGLTPSFEDSQLTNTIDDREDKLSSLQPDQASGLSRSAVDESLNSLDITEDIGGRKQRKVKPPKKPKKFKKIKWIIILIMTIILSIGIYLGVKAFIASGNMFHGNIFGLAQSKPLKVDKNGRSNILVFGTSEDDIQNGKQHAGALLTDSMMVLSIDQKTNEAASFSIPRDLQVEYGRLCMEGSYGKINSYYKCMANDKEDSPEGAKALKDFVGKVVGLDIQYYAHVNYGVVRDAVDAVDGVDVDILGNGPVPYGVKPGSILDRNFDWKCSYKCYMVKYEPGVHHLDGEHALALARARGADGGYGLPRSNFDREINQQKIVIALVKRASEAGTLANLGKVTGLIDAMGKNLRTNFDTSEIRTLMDIGTKIAKNNQMKSISLVDAEPKILDGDGNPVLGDFNYTAIQAYIKQKLSSDLVVREGAQIGVFNGSGEVGIAKTQADKLEAKGLTIGLIGDAPAGKYPEYSIYILNNKMTATQSRLEGIYGVKATVGEAPFTTSGLDVIIIIGEAPITAKPE